MGKNVLSEGYEEFKVKTLKVVLGDELPDWIPDGDVKLIDHAIMDFIGQGFKPEEMGSWVCGEAEFPVNRLSPVLIGHIVYLLKVKRALILGENQGILLLLGGKQTHRVVKLTRKAKDSKGGKGKGGHEGPLKQYIREVITGKDRDFDVVLAALEDHLMVADVTDKKLTYVLPNGKIKDVTLQAVKKAYREIIENF